MSLVLSCFRGGAWQDVRAWQLLQMGDVLLLLFALFGLGHTRQRILHLLLLDRFGSASQIV